METEKLGGLKPALLFIWIKFRGFLMRAVLVALIVSPIQLSGRFTSLAWPLLILAASGCLFTLLLGRTKEKGYLFCFLTVGIPMVVVLGFVMGIPAWAIVAIAIFTLWAMLKELEVAADDELLEGNDIIPATVIVGLFVWITGALFQLAFLYPVLCLVLFQLVLFSQGKFVKRLIESEKPFKNKGNATTMVLAIFCIPAAAGLILVSLSGFLRTILRGFLDLFTSLLTFLMEPVMRVFSNVLYGSMTNELPIADVPEGESGLSENENLLTFENTGSSIGLMIIVIAVFIIITVVVLKNMKFTRIQNQVGNKVIAMKTRPIEVAGEKKLSVNPGYSRAEHVIRKEMKSLEKFAYKNKLERAHYETIREWLNRIGIHSSPNWIAVYEKVRYGSAKIDEKDVEIFTTELKMIKSNLKLQSNKGE